MNNTFRIFLESSFHFQNLNEQTYNELIQLRKFENPYIVVNENGMDAIQTINSNFLIYLIDFSEKKHICYLMSEESVDAAVIPQTTSSVSHLHKHNYIEFIYILEGSLEFVIEGERKRYRKNECCVINQNVRHVEGYNSDFMAIYLSIRSDYIKSLNLFKNTTGALNSFLLRNIDYGSYYDYLDFFPTESRENKLELSKTEEVLLRIVMEMIEKQAGYHDIVLGHIKRLISYLESNDKHICNNTKYSTSENENLFERTRQYLNSHRYKVTRDELSNELHYNGNYISKVFYDHTGISMAAYNRDIYLQEAAYLLLNTTLSISEIANKLGFENRTAFYTQFKRKYHVTPKCYRIDENKIET